MIVVRLTRHFATKAQVNALEDAFGHVDIVTVSESLPVKHDEAVVRFDFLVKQADVVEIVLPIELVEVVIKNSEFCKNGGLLIKSVMIRQLTGHGAEFTFDHYEVIEKVKIDTYPLKGSQHDKSYSKNH